MNFPLQLRFKLLALAPQISVTDAAGAPVFYSKQQLLKFKETINVFTDQNQSTKSATIAADSIVTFSAKFNFTDAGGHALGGIGRKGFRSIWRAHYDVFTAAGEPAGTIREENPFAKVMDALLCDIPFVGIFAGYLFQPRYLLTAADGKPILSISKKPSFFESHFQIDSLAALSEEETKRDILAVIMLVMLERHRK